MKQVRRPQWVLGLDVSATSTGVALVCELPKVTPLYFTLKPPAKMRSIARANWQLVKLHQRLEQFRRIKGSIGLACIEGYPYLGRRLAVLVEVGALFRWAVMRDGMQVFEVAPMTLKKFVLGVAARPGAANQKAQNAKQLMRKRILREFRGRLPRDPGEDEVDALGLAWIGASLYGRFSLSDPQLDVLETIQTRGVLDPIKPCPTPQE